MQSIFNLVKSLTQSESYPNEDRNFTYSLEAINSSLFFKQGSQAKADKIHLKSIDDTVGILLEHGKGNIVLEVEGEEFSIEGKGLNDTFMNNLIEGAKFQNGQMNMAAKGTFDKFSALFKIDNTVLRGLKSVSSIMAFLDTIPALITFSLPEYNSKGLPISSAVVGMMVAEGLATFESFEVKSPVLSMAGTGWIDITKSLIDMDFNLITGAKTNLNKIPLLGFVMVGKEKKPSITVKVTGDLQDPKVDNSVFREVATKPVSILYRTLSLPLHLVDSMSDSLEKEQSTENTTDSSESAK